MAFLTVKAESVAKEGGSGYINTSGIYDVNLRACEIAATTNGATQANYIMDKCMSYGNTVINKAGQPIFGMDILEALAATLGEDGLSDPEATDVAFKKATKELMCIPELVDVDVKVWIQFEYSLYKGEIRENVNVKRFYRQSDGASGSEVLSGEGIGTQVAKDEAYASEIKYSDGTDEESVKAWKKAQADASKGATKAAVAPKAATAAFPGVK